MGKNRKYIAKIFHSLFGVVFVFAGVLLFGTSTKAAGDVTRYRTAYLQNCCPGIQVVAHAYLVGNDNVANYWKTIAVDFAVCIPIDSGLYAAATLQSL